MVLKIIHQCCLSGFAGPAFQKITVIKDLTRGIFFHCFRIHDIFPKAKFTNPSEKRARNFSKSQKKDKQNNNNNKNS